MKPPKTNWRREAEKLRRQLNNCKTVLVDNERLKKESDYCWNELKNRPTLGKIVEKEVLPNWSIFLMIGCVWFELVFGFVFWKGFKKLQTPILSPYPVMMVNGKVLRVVFPEKQVFKHHSISVLKNIKPRIGDCGPGFEPVGGACAEVNGKSGHEVEKDELGYPKQ